MFDYFFTLDKLYGDKMGVVNTNELQKGLWYKYIDKDGQKVLLVDVAGVNENDLNIDFEEDSYNGYIVIKGKTSTDFGDFEINRRFKIPVTYLSNDSSYTIKDGILYITIVPQEKTKFHIKKAN